LVAASTKIYSSVVRSCRCSKTVCDSYSHACAAFIMPPWFAIDFGHPADAVVGVVGDYRFGLSQNLVCGADREVITRGVW
jgi:hypothetical protein